MPYKILGYRCVTHLCTYNGVVAPLKHVLPHMRYYAEFGRSMSNYVGVSTRGAPQNWIILRLHPLRYKAWLTSLKTHPPHMCYRIWLLYVKPYGRRQ